MPLRNGIILGLTLLGVVMLSATMALEQDRTAALAVAAVGCWLLARVYAEVTRR